MKGPCHENSYFVGFCSWYKLGGCRRFSSRADVEENDLVIELDPTDQISRQFGAQRVIRAPIIIYHYLKIMTPNLITAMTSFSRQTHSAVISNISQHISDQKVAKK